MVQLSLKIDVYTADNLASMGWDDYIAIACLETDIACKYGDFRMTIGLFSLILNLSYLL